MRTYGHPLKRARSLPQSSPVSGGVAADPLQVYRPPAGRAAPAWQPTALQRSPSSSQSSTSASPPPSAFRSQSLSREWSGSLARPPTASPSSRSESSRLASQREEEEDDPFADTFATQPLDDDEEALPAAAPSVAAKSLSSSFSAAAAAAPTPALARSSTSSSSSAALQLSGASRARADEVQFLIDGLGASESASVRAQSALSLARLLLEPPATPDEADGMCLLRAGGGFDAIAHAIPDASEITKTENEVFAALFTIISFVSRTDLTNASFFTPHGIDILLALALEPGHAKRVDGDGMSADTEAAPTVSASPSLIRKSKKRMSHHTPTAPELSQLLVQHQKREHDGAIDRAKQMHLDSLSDLGYLSLIALASLSADSDFLHHLLHSSRVATQEELVSSLVHMASGCMTRVREMVPAPAAAKATATPSRSRGVKKRGATTSSQVPLADAYFLQNHRLLCCLAVIENCTHHDTTLFGHLCETSAHATPTEMVERKSCAADERDSVDSGAQLLFDILALMSPHIDRHQQGDVDSSDERAADSSSVNLLPTTDSHPITAIFTILRILVNVTNRNEVGVAALNRIYRYGAETQSSGLQCILRLVSSIRWSRLSHVSGHPDMFNLLSVGLPVVVNSVEWSPASLDIVGQDCRVSMLPENADLAAAALSELPPPSTSAADPFAPSSDGTVPALHFICSLWSYLHQQLQLLAAKHNAESEAKAAEAPEADQPLTEDLTLDQRVADPFAAVAASRVNASDAPVVAGNEVEAQLAAKIDEANEAEEEMSLGYRTLASMTSLLLGFFACSSAACGDHLLSALRLTSFAPLLRYIQEFLVLQSDSQLLQQEGLETTFRMVEQLKKRDRMRATIESVTASESAALIENNSEDEGEAKTGKKAKLTHTSESAPAPASLPPSASASSRSLSTPVRMASAASATSSPSPCYPTSAAATFDQLFNQQQARANGK